MDELRIIRLESEKPLLDHDKVVNDRLACFVKLEAGNVLVVLDVLGKEDGLLVVTEGCLGEVEKCLPVGFFVLEALNFVKLISQDDLVEFCWWRHLSSVEVCVCVCAER